MTELGVKWACEYCTYENWPSAIKCTMCRAQRPSGTIITEEPFKSCSILDPPHGDSGGSSLLICPDSSARPRVRQTQSSESSTKWSCHMCTYLNWPRAVRCTQCLCQRQRSCSPTETPQTSGSGIRVRSGPVPHVDPCEEYNDRNRLNTRAQRWICAACTYENWPKSPRCVVCDHPRPNDAIQLNEPEESPVINEQDRVRLPRAGGVCGPVGQRRSPPTSKRASEVQIQDIQCIELAAGAHGSKEELEIDFKKLKQIKNRMRKSDWLFLNACAERRLKGRSAERGAVYQHFGTKRQMLAGFRAEAGAQVQSLSHHRSDSVSVILNIETSTLFALRPSLDITQTRSRLSLDITQTRPRLSRDITQTRPRPSLDITQTRPRPSLDITQTRPRPSLDITQTRPRPSLDITQTRPRPSLDITQTRPRPSLDITQTLSRPSLDITQTRSRLSLDITETPSRLSLDITQTCSRLSLDITQTRSRLSLDITQTRSRPSLDITQTRSRPSLDITQTRSRPSLDITQTRSRPSLDITQTRLDITQTRSRLSLDITETSLSLDITQTRSRLSLDITQTRSRLSLDITQTRSRPSLDITQTRSRLSLDITQTRSRPSLDITQTRSRPSLDITQTRSRPSLDITQTRVSSQSGHHSDSGLVPVWTSLRLGLDITQTRPRPSLDITQTLSRPSLDITQTLSRPSLDITQTLSRPSLDITQTRLRPSLDITQTRLRPSLDITQTRPRPSLDIIRVVEGDLAAVEAYKSSGFDIARQLTADEVRLLNRPSAFDEGFTLVHLAIRFQRQDMLAILLTEVSQQAVKCIPAMVCPELTEQIRREIAASLHQRKGDFACYFLTDLVTFTLPADIEDLPPAVQEKLFDEVLDRDVQKELEEESAVINWSLELGTRLDSRLYALWNRTAGDCLLDSVLQATWGIYDKDSVLRKTLHDSLHDCSHWFYTRWKEWESWYSQSFGLHFSLREEQWQEDWAFILSLASQPGASLEQTHIFVLAHILRRPIIVYGVKYYKSFRGETLGYTRFQGVYLPLLWEQSFCWKSPIALGYTRGHFSALVAMETDGYDNRGAGANLNTDDDVTVTFLPLVDSERKLLHIHFLSAQEMGNEEQQEKLLREWLDCCVTDGGMLAAMQKSCRRRNHPLVTQMVEKWLDGYRQIRPCPTLSDGEEEEDEEDE
ncbi:hypothetical protein NFI96_028876 [Prochilodus magdalenae]|nr:hypothetical protein NFI96_028876 [Prochilodus magdalenae]